MIFFGSFALLAFGATVIHRMHSIQQLHHKGDVTANYWGTYAKPGEEPKKPEKKKSRYPKMTDKGTLTLPATSNQNTSCIAGKVTSRGK
jgi:hypothetical protein